MKAEKNTVRTIDCAKVSTSSSNVSFQLKPRYTSHAARPIDKVIASVKITAIALRRRWPSGM